MSNFRSTITCQKKACIQIFEILNILESRLLDILRIKNMQRDIIFNKKEVLKARC